jgi:hypothetical protein
MATAPQADQIRIALFGALDLGREKGAVQEDVGSQLDVLVAMVPEPYVWAVIGEGEDSRVVLLAGDALFTIWPREPLKLAVSRISCEVRRVEHWRRDNDESSWKFAVHRLDKPICIDGQTRPELNDAEKLARALASLAGWLVGPSFD